MRYRSLDDLKTRCGGLIASQAEQRLARGGDRPAKGREAVKSVTITLPLPPRELSPNSRCHWSAKARAVHRYRAAACLAMRIATHFEVLGWARATVAIRYWFGDRRRRDADNLLAQLKAAFDGIADAGLIVNDSGLTYLPVEVGVDRGRERVEITVEKQS